MSYTVENKILTPTDYCVHEFVKATVIFLYLELLFASIWI